MCKTFVNICSFLSLLLTDSTIKSVVYFSECGVEDVQ
jgi:hypothetical protein